jgi:hypothetical protein
MEGIGREDKGREYTALVLLHMKMARYHSQRKDKNFWEVSITCFSLNVSIFI